MARDQYIQPGSVPVLSQNNNYKTSIGNVNLDPSNTISSKGNIINGTNNSVTGPNNIVSGTGHVVSGTTNFVFGTNHNIASDSNIILGGDNHSVEGGSNVVIGGGQGLSVNGSTLALTSLNEIDLYIGATGLNNTISSTLTTLTGIITGSGSTSNFVLDNTLNNGISNYKTISFNVTLKVLTTTTVANPYTLLFSDLFGSQQTTGYLRTISKGVNLSTGASHQNWYVREQEHFFFWTGTTLNTSPSFTDHSLFTGSGIDWGSTSADAIAGYATVTSSGAFFMVVTNTGAPHSTVDMKWSFDVEIRFTSSNT
jgi:hypothetical protein